ncbi:membrane protein YdbS with pleckstrin-like domain [Catenuloplanes nepalensis]|uniref:Membrane protein YdbS with pleckstrin-like domain n=1 Tax=Catenuloplanes nepalensis TaxID=587533 RepID=A0ABT9MS36_9ACTN|nr:hypothetical protein [Catenuloplanes nepalensis]MDP9794220.1 membrane protein YdbS with pleckstrin-like domain [Catenuloplanes nepalensis]
MSERRSAGGRPPGHDLVRGGLRFLAEIVAWVAVPWALWPHSAVLAIGALVLLIVPSAIFSTPGDRPGGDTPVAVPGIVTILLLLVQLVAATVSAWVLWPVWIAAVVTALCLVVVVTEQPRWRALTGR